MQQQIVTLYNDLVGTDLLTDTNIILRTTDAVLVPPKSEALIPVIVPHQFRSGLAIIEPSVQLHKLQLALARSIVTPMNNRTVCKVMNPRDVARFLKRRTPLGLYMNSIWITSQSLMAS